MYSLAISAWANNETLWTWGLDVLHFKIDEIWTEDYNKSDEAIINLNVFTKRILL